MHGQVSVTAVNQICVNHEAMNSCSSKNLKKCFENVNIINMKYNRDFAGTGKIVRVKRVSSTLVILYRKG